MSAEELTAWSFLVAATGRAMLDVLPQLEGGRAERVTPDHYGMTPAQITITE